MSDSLSFRVTHHTDHPPRSSIMSRPRAILLAGLLILAIPVLSTSSARAADAGFPFARRDKLPAWPPNVTWLNTAGPIELHDLRGKFVLLDFWTYCCINCMHILPE